MKTNLGEDFGEALIDFLFNGKQQSQRKTMKTSELIARLQELMKEHGDLPATYAMGLADIEENGVYFTTRRTRDGEEGVICLTTD